MASEYIPIPRRLTLEGYKRLGTAQLEEIRRRLHDRHPDDELTSIEAAIYCGVSVRTIKRAIDAGKGPDRRKNVDATGNHAVNRHVRFPKRGLDAWKKSMAAFETISGQFNSFDDLVIDEPWVMDGDKIDGHLFDVGDIDAVMTMLAEGDIEFYRLDEALRQRWSSISLRKIYEVQFRKVVEFTQDEIEIASARDVQDVETLEVSKSGEPIRF